MASSRGAMASSWGARRRTSAIRLAPTGTTDTLIETPAKRRGGSRYMAIHLTPTELGREAGMHRREVISKCMELGVPIFQGRIDKTLFISSLKEAQQRRELAKA
jgi:hypothetical protein